MHRGDNIPLMAPDWFDPDKLREMARAFTVQAREVSARERDYAVDMARSYLILSKNAAWLRSTDEFLKAMSEQRRWPRPSIVAQELDSPG